MASVLLNVVGTAVGGPIGGAIGALLGAAIDSTLIASMSGNGGARNVEGARLADLRVMSSTEGGIIPRIFGRMRVGGNVIWATDFREEVKTTTTSAGGGKGGGGGGGSVTTTNYYYYCSFAVALCEGPISGIGRIWADGKPLTLKDAVYRVHKGTEDQLPDPLIQSFMGAGKTPAYRGVAYVVFDNLPLETFGNRLPQLSFEVFRPTINEDSTERLIRSVNMIPGGGEYVYATEGVTYLDNLPSYNYTTHPENINTTDPEGRADFLVSLDTLEETIPNINSISLVVSWFGTDLRCGSCQIKPAVVAVNRYMSHFWIVNGFSRGAPPHIISNLPNNGGVAYGGTPADFSVVQAIQEIKSRGIKITFYPFLMMDIPAMNTLPNPYSDNASESGQPKYPWRGRITCSPAPGYAGTVDKTGAAASQVAAFFGNAEPSDYFVSGTTVTWIGSAGDWGLRRQVLHYAHLCKAAGGVDSFIIGSELRGLTCIRSAPGTYPAVAELISLAAAVRSILGSETKISYAADWSEYFGHHPQDGSGDVYFHLDPLWADSNIDFIGIDNYMPLSDWRDGLSHADALAGWGSIYNPEYLAANVEGGEGYDWYYPTEADRNSQNRVAITDGEGKPWVFRYKDIRSWWKNAHYNRPGGVESGAPTDWVPESKPIRFTEAGCPAVDKGTNQPNVFFDSKSAESAFPYFSRGARDDFIQRRYIETIYNYWAAENETSSVYAGPMLDISELSIWTWDARPFPFFPGRNDIWSDAENWRLGHWLSGRMGAGGLADVVREICLRAGISAGMIDVSGLNATVPGYIIDSLQSARSSIEPLARFYGFDAIESDGAIRFVSRGVTPVGTVLPDDLVAGRSGEAEDIEFARAQETELPLALKWRLVQSGDDYGGITVEARRITVDTARINAEHFPIANSAAEADTRCRRALFEEWIARERVSLQLPPSRLALEPADVMLLEHDNRVLEYRIVSIADTEARTVEAVRSDIVLYGARPAPERLPSVPQPTVYGPPITAFLDLPLIHEDIPAHRPYIAVYASPWYGRAAIYRSPSADNFSLLETAGTPANLGELAFDFYANGAAGRNFDLANELYIDLYSGTVSSVSDIDLFAGANTAAIESAPGIWEIVQFGNAELIDTARYKCTRLLRGQLGTEGAMGNPAPAGARVVLLNTALVPLGIQEADIGLSYNWRIGPASEAVGADSFAEVSFTAEAVGMRPYSVCHVVQPYKTARAIGNLEIHWKRRTRSPAGDSWAAVEIPLFETEEAYQVDILNGATVLRTLSATSPAVTYSEADQIADWGAALGPGDALGIAIYQVAPAYGRGAPKFETLYF